MGAGLIGQNGPYVVNRVTEVTVNAAEIAQIQSKEKVPFHVMSREKTHRHKPATQRNAQKVSTSIFTVN